MLQYHQTKEKLAFVNRHAQAVVSLSLFLFVKSDHTSYSFAVTGILLYTIALSI